MNSRYKKSMENEGKIYKEIKGDLSVPQGNSTGWEELDKALDWLCDGTSYVLDFGCGIGTMLFLCANRGTKKHIGIDLSVEGIECAEICSNMMNNGEYQFHVGSVEQLRSIEDKSVDAIILSNIIDNLYPEDARIVLLECSRILKTNGKILVKLNPYITPEQIWEWKMIELEKDVYDDGFILWNRNTEDWKNELNNHFRIVDYYEFYVPQAEQVNRVFLLSN